MTHSQTHQFCPNCNAMLPAHLEECPRCNHRFGGGADVSNKDILRITCMSALAVSVPLLVFIVVTIACINLFK